MRPITPAIDRILAKCVEDHNGCWIWTARLRPDGYAPSIGEGRSGPMLRPHRVTYAYFRAPIPEGLCLDHLCRVPACVNPWHLEPVTLQVNTLRGLVPQVNGEHNRRKTHCPKGHPYDDENTRLKTDKFGYVHRVCKACHYVPRQRKAAA